MKEINGINYIEKESDWKDVKKTNLVNVNGGLQEGYFFRMKYLEHGQGLTEKFPVIIRRERLSIVEDVVGDMPIVHDKGLSGEYYNLDKFLTEECSSIK